MDIYTQYFRTLTIATAFFLTGAITIEFAQTKLIEWCGRATILCSVGILACYGYWASEKYAEVHGSLAEMRMERQIEMPADGMAYTSIGTPAFTTVVTRGGMTISYSGATHADMSGVVGSNRSRRPSYRRFGGGKGPDRPADFSTQWDSLLLRHAIPDPVYGGRAGSF